MGKEIILKTWLTISIFLAALPAGATAAGRIIYVDADATGANDGSSWSDGYNYLQDALTNANDSEKPLEIWVAQGVYKPDQGADITVGEREATFQLLDGVSLKGGFAGLTEPDPNVRDIRLYETLLTGDFADDDVTWNELLDIRALHKPQLTEPNREDNTYNVVTGTGTDETAVLDGFTIAGGCAYYPESSGGGIYIDAGSPTIINCIFTRNSAYESGGGMHCENESNPTLTNCIFSRNWALYCGGMYNSNSDPSLTNCTFTENFAAVPPGVIIERGYLSSGGMHNSRSSPTLTNCSFRDNLSRGMLNSESHPNLTNCMFTGNTGGFGAGMCNLFDSNPVLTDCTFAANFAKYSFGGGMRNYESNPILTNCIFTGNKAETGGGISGGSPTLINCTFTGNSADEAGGISGGSPTLTNCIVWGNTFPQIVSNASISFSSIQGGFLGEGNINADPLFADPEDGDYHLKSEAGRWDPDSQSWVMDNVTSPCIDGGDPMSPIGLEPFPNGGIINMGAYGGTPQASKSPAN